MMAAKIKSMKSIIDKIIFPLIVAAITSLTLLFFRVQALEIKLLSVEDYIKESKEDLTIIRCHVTKDPITCMKAKALP